jgi:hypothetical protein
MRSSPTPANAECPIAALEPQRGERHLPSLPDLADPVAVGDVHAVEEDLVEGGAAGHLAEGAHRHPGGVHVDDEGGEVAVAGLGRGAAEDLADAGEMRPRGPHLLPGDPPAVALAHRAGGDRCEVGAGVRLGEELAGDEIAAVQRGEKAATLLLGAVTEDRRRDHPEADDEHRVAGHLEGAGQRLEAARVGARTATAAVLDRAVDPAESGVEEAAPPSAHRGEVVRLGLGIGLLEDLELVAALTPDEGGGLGGGLPSRPARG